VSGTSDTQVPDAWVVLLPVKDLVHAKSRLLVPDRAALALAMVRDTVTAARCTPGVKEVWLVTNDPDAAAAFPAEPDPPRDLSDHLDGGGTDGGGTDGGGTDGGGTDGGGTDGGGTDGGGTDGGGTHGGAPEGRRQPGPVRVVPDWPAAGLNAAVTYAAGLVDPATPVAVLAGDLPALRPQELALALEAARGHDRAIVTDAPGMGTVLLTSVHPAALAPAFGTGSRILHVAAGAVDLTDQLTGRVAGLQQDVDTAADLAAALALGPGAATGALLATGADPAEHLCAPFGTIDP
jgi:2-phospho-L-lactate guanylyltransferase